MRIWISFFVSFLMPFAAIGQSNPVVLKSEGQMYIGGSTSTTTSMYVVGSAVFTSDQKDQTTVKLDGQMELTGNLIDDMIGATGVDADVLIDAADQGTILFSGKDRQQKIYRSSRSEMSLSHNHYLNIPNLYVRQPVLTTETPTNIKELRNVYLDPTMAINVGTLDVTGGNRFRVGASYLNGRSKSWVKSGYMMLGNFQDSYSNDSQRGYGEVFLSLYDSSNGDGNETGRPGFRNLVGFGSPFEELGADHMFFNVLTRPHPYSVTSYEGPVIDPKYKLKSGEGHFIGIDVSPYDHTDIEAAWGTQSANRAKGTYEFSRYMLNKYNVVGGSKEKFSMNDNGAIKERFNTGDVSVVLRPGLNFLANPFMAPIDLSGILNESNMTTLNYTVPELGGVQVARKIPASSAIEHNPMVLRDRFWVVGNSSMSEAGGKFYYTISYYDVLPNAGTAALGNKGAISNLGVSWSERTYVSPMQMFIVQVAGWGTLTLKKELQTLNVLGNSNIHLPKSQKDTEEGGTVADDLKDLPDQILLQAEVVGEDRDDRACIVFTDDSKFSSTDDLDSRKGLAESLESDEQGELKTLGGLIYTKATDGNKAVPMLTNSLPKNIKQLALYVYPTYETQEMVIRPYRMETLKDIQKIWLEDKFENKVIELTPETEYRFVSEPLTENEAQENRFVLYFNEMPENWDGDGQTSNGEIVCYYKNTAINIIGLNESDINSRVQIYDMQGRMVFSSMIKDVPKSTYLKTLAQGTYIVKITGKRNFTSKFVSVEN